MSVALVRANQPNPRGFEPRSAIDFTRFASLKGEFEAEGLTAIELASEAIWAARRGLTIWSRSVAAKPSRTLSICRSSASAAS